MPFDNPDNVLEGARTTVRIMNIKYLLFMHNYITYITSNATFKKFRRVMKEEYFVQIF